MWRSGSPLKKHPFVERGGGLGGGDGGGGREEMTGRGGETVCKRGCRERVASLGCLWFFSPPSRHSCIMTA